MILITGATGFVGPYLIKELEKKYSRDEIIGTDLSGDADLVLDVTDKDAVEKSIKELKPEYIYHLAGFSSVKKSFDHPELCHKINVEGTKNILNAIKLYSPTTKILIISSAEIYGNPLSIPMTENHALNPISPYGESRLAQEKLLAEYDLNWYVARSFPHTGPGQPKGFVTADFASQIAAIKKSGSDESIEVGNLESIRDFSDVRDVVNAYVTICENSKPKEIYNVSSGIGITIRDILNKFISIAEIDNKVVISNGKYRPIDIKELIGSNDKLKNNLGWQPKYNFMEDTLPDILDYWK